MAKQTGVGSTGPGVVDLVMAASVVAVCVAAACSIEVGVVGVEPGVI